MQKSAIVLTLVLLVACKSEQQSEAKKHDKAFPTVERISLTLEEANRLVELPMDCIDVEFPNKLGQVIGSYNDLAAPSELHPAFYGCFDWHSAVHGHWSLVRLLNEYPAINNSDAIMKGLLFHLSAENIALEIEYFEDEYNSSYERMYGWAWLLKLTEEIQLLKNSEGKELLRNISPLSDLIVEKVKEFLPKLNYPIRVGTHTNTAFAMTMIYDYSLAFKDNELKDLITNRARSFYFEDNNCPLEWEPSGFDFLSPCLEEADIMRRVLSKDEFKTWIDKFLPQLSHTSFALEPGIVTDREDGHLVHLDGLNYSRAWCLYGIAETLPEYGHLKQIANNHINYTLPSLTDGNYEGGHWLASFALLALSIQ